MHRLHLVLRNRAKVLKTPLSGHSNNKKSTPNICIRWLGRRVSLRLIKGGAATSRMTGNVTGRPSWTGASSGITLQHRRWSHETQNGTGTEYSARYSVLLRNSIASRCSGTLKQGDYYSRSGSGSGKWGDSEKRG